MFCPSCGGLSFPNPKGEIACSNYKCKYKGPANIVIRDVDGRDVDLSKAKTHIAAKGRTFQVVKDSDEIHGRLTTGTYTCPNCECDKMEVFSDVDMVAEFSETPTTRLTCKNCNHLWSER